MEGDRGELILGAALAFV